VDDGGGKTGNGCHGNYHCNYEGFWSFLRRCLRDSVWIVWHDFEILLHCSVIHITHRFLLGSFQSMGSKKKKREFIFHTSQETSLAV